MYILPIIDLWKMNPAYFALVDEQSNIYKPENPHELREMIFEADSRFFRPFVIPKGRYWEEFRKTKLLEPMSGYENPLLGYENGVVFDGDKVVFDENAAEPEHRWVRGIQDKETLKDIMRQEIRYGSGDALDLIIPMNYKKPKEPRVWWI